MIERELKTIYDEQRKRRLVFFQRTNGTIGFRAEYFSEDPFELCWMPKGPDDDSICDTFDTAVREARGRVSWITPEMLQEKA